MGGKKLGLAGLYVLSLLASPVVLAAGTGSIDQRLTRLEQKLDNQTLVEMTLRIDRLEREIQQLRGLVEEQSHGIQELRQHQRDLYLDLDRRLSRLEQEAGGGGPAAGAGSREGDREAPPSTTGEMAPVSSVPVISPEDVEKERLAYQQAFDELRGLRYEQAITGFESFLAAYPQSNNAHIAQYWMGEAHYAQRNFSRAIRDYETLLANYPRSPKLAEAMLKIGYSQYELGDREAARGILGDLVKKYPDSTEAGQAGVFLQKMRSEGN